LSTSKYVVTASKCVVVECHHKSGNSSPMSATSLLLLLTVAGTKQCLLQHFEGFGRKSRSDWLPIFCWIGDWIASDDELQNDAEYTGTENTKDSHNFSRLVWKKTFSTDARMVDHGASVGSSRLQRPISSSSRIRSNLMFKLGVEAERYTEKVQKRAPSRGSLLGNVQLSKEPLKYKEEEDESRPAGSSLWGIVSIFTRQAYLSETEGAEAPLSSSLSSQESSTSSEGSRPRRLTFNEEVSVCPIPKRDEYSKRIREWLWASPEEMMLNAHRNSVEFAAEGWDWRTVMEDENMYRCVETNELIHPIHIEQQLEEDIQQRE
jgi:hypothetical protein